MKRILHTLVLCHVFYSVKKIQFPFICVYCCSVVCFLKISAYLHLLKKCPEVRRPNLHGIQTNFCFQNSTGSCFNLRGILMWSKPPAQPRPSHLVHAACAIMPRGETTPCDSHGRRGARHRGDVFIATAWINSRFPYCLLGD